MIIDLAAAADLLLRPTLARHGLVPGHHSQTSATFSGEGRTLELSYYPEDPVPWLNVKLGLAESTAPGTLALWRLYPEAGALSSLDAGRFDSAESLSEHLVTIRDDWLGRYIWPAFEQPDRFQDAWRAQQEETERRYREDVLGERLSHARRAYDNGDFAKTVEQYTLAGLGDLSAADRRRYTLARRALEREKPS